MKNGVHKAHTELGTSFLRTKGAGDAEISNKPSESVGQSAVSRYNKVTSGVNASKIDSYQTFRGVRSLKHKYDRNYQEVLRKSNSLNDLSSDGKDDSTVETRTRSRSRDSAERSHSVSESLTRNNDEDEKPKTFFESLMSPESPPPKNARYLRLASIPKSTRPIENYMNRARSQSPKQRDSKKTGVNITSKVACTTRLWESRSKSTDARTAANNLHGQRTSSTSTAHSLATGRDSMLPQPRRSRRDLSKALTKTSSSPSTSSTTTSSHLPRPSTTSSTSPSHRRSVQHSLTSHTTIACQDAESPQQDAVRRSRSPSPGRRAQPDVAESRESRRVRSPTSTLLLNGKHKNETDERKVGNTTLIITAS